MTVAKEDAMSEQQPSQSGENSQESEGRPSWLRRAANRAGRGFQRAGQEISDASRSTGQVIQRSGEVLTGADIRRFDEFTEAVTRVAVGLHHDQTDTSRRVGQLEQESTNFRQLQGQLVERVARLEQESADIRQFQGELAERVAHLEQERQQRNSVGILRRIWRALFG
ncbi:MAG: hypothetical protein F4X27_05285 [Chloroflexi bacterium]|nr:hypothetical protein [Chloroflexota bacterium]